eukprot:11113362-Prorocentrum_lima.AAC.1
MRIAAEESSCASVALSTCGRCTSRGEDGAASFCKVCQACSIVRSVIARSQRSGPLLVDYAEDFLWIRWFRRSARLQDEAAFFQASAGGEGFACGSFRHPLCACESPCTS